MPVGEPMTQVCEMQSFCPAMFSVHDMPAGKQRSTTPMPPGPLSMPQTQPSGQSVATLHWEVQMPVDGIEGGVVHQRLWHWVEFPRAEHSEPFGVQTCCVLAPICVSEHEKPIGQARLERQGVVQTDSEVFPGWTMQMPATQFVG